MRGGVARTCRESADMCRVVVHTCRGLVRMVVVPLYWRGRMWGVARRIELVPVCGRMRMCPVVGRMVVVPVSPFARVVVAMVGWLRTPADVAVVPM